jgi:hypothetical protein
MSWNEGPTIHPTSQEELYDPGVNVIRENLQTSITYPEYIPDIYLIYISGIYQVYTYHLCATHIVASLSYMYILKHIWIPGPVI